PAPRVPGATTASPGLPRGGWSSAAYERQWWRAGQLPGGARSRPMPTQHWRCQRRLARRPALRTAGPSGRTGRWAWVQCCAWGDSFLPVVLRHPASGRAGPGGPDGEVAAPDRYRHDPGVGISLRYGTLTRRDRRRFPDETHVTTRG